MVLQVPEAPWTWALTVLLMTLLNPMAQGSATPGRMECCARNGSRRYVETYVAEYYNSQKDFMEQKRAAVDAVCRHIDQLNQAGALARRVQPKVHVSPSKKGSLQHHDLLVCHVTDFYPGHIRVQWFLNGREETDGVVSTNLIRNGDWTFQILVMLEMTPQQGDVYTCRVEHPSLDIPVTVEWKAQSDSAWRKMLTGILGFVLGLLVLLMSFLPCFRSH